MKSRGVHAPSFRRHRPGAIRSTTPARPARPRQRKKIAESEAQRMFRATSSSRNVPIESRGRSRIRRPDYVSRSRSRIVGPMQILEHDDAQFAGGLTQQCRGRRRRLHSCPLHGARHAAPSPAPTMSTTGANGRAGATGFARAPPGPELPSPPRCRRPRQQSVVPIACFATDEDQLSAFRFDLRRVGRYSCASTSWRSRARRDRTLSCASPGYIPSSRARPRRPVRRRARP